MSTRDNILAVAIAELESKGIENLSLRAIGVKAGITPMAVYRHFSNKAELLQTLGEHALDQWRRRIDALGDLPLIRGFDAMVTAFVDFAFDAPALFDAAFILKTHAERVYPEDFEAGRSPVIGGLARRLAAGQNANLVREGPPLELAIAVWGVLQGLVGLHRSGRFSLSRSDFTALCVRSAARIYLKEDVQ